MLGSFTHLDTKKYKVKTLVIDAGHGGKDPGCHGKISNEAALTLKVALELGKLIKENDPNIKMISNGAISAISAAAAPARSRSKRLIIYRPIE